MNELKLTPWFPRGTKPARDGVYEVVFFVTPGYAHYRSGENWSWLCETPQEAATALPAGTEKPQWRGLAKNPSPAGRTSEK